MSEKYGQRVWSCYKRPWKVHVLNQFSMGQFFSFCNKNPAYGRHWISLPMLLEAPIIIFFFLVKDSFLYGVKKIAFKKKIAVEEQKIGEGPNIFF